MIRQYAPTVSRSRMVETARGPMQCGVVPVGTICRPGGWMPKVIVEAWVPRDYATWDPARRQMEMRRILGGHIARVRCLRSGRRFDLSDAWLIDTETA